MMNCNHSLKKQINSGDEDGDDADDGANATFITGLWGVSGVPHHSQQCICHVLSKPYQG